MHRHDTFATQGCEQVDGLCFMVKMQGCKNGLARRPFPMGKVLQAGAKIVRTRGSLSPVWWPQGCPLKLAIRTAPVSGWWASGLAAVAVR
jgi:hypothetical protein